MPLQSYFRRAMQAIPLMACLATVAAPNSSIFTPAAKPAWLTDLSLTLKEGYDDNVFLAGANPKDLPNPYPQPSGSAAALRDRSSWVTTVSPKLGLNLLALLGDQKALQVLSLTYAPEISVYHDTPSENYQAHRLSSALKCKLDSFSFNLENGFSFVNGNKIAPTYPGSFFSAYATAAPRERREQIQDKGALTFQYDHDKWFVRPAAFLMLYGLMTEQINVPGYQNYPDRYDVNGGSDLGYKILPQTSVFIGYRYGSQHQQQISFSPYSSSSDYHRLLFGFEGKPWKWLDVKFQGGPDFRHYPGDTADHITPVDDKNPVKYYGESCLTATLTTQDKITFKYKQFQWVSSTGKIPYYDSIFDLGYRRKLSDRINLDLGARFLSSDYNSGNLSACRRDDTQYTLSSSLSYSPNQHLTASISYSLDLGRNAEDGIVNQQTRQYDRSVTSLSLTLLF